MWSHGNHRFVKTKWRYIAHASRHEKSQWAFILVDWRLDCLIGVSFAHIVFRGVERLRFRWGDMINLFCKTDLHVNSWSDLALWPKADIIAIEEMFRNFCDDV